MKIEVELNPWLAPSCVTVKAKPGLKQEGMKESQVIDIWDLDEKTLAGLCDEFRREVFRKAGKKDPQKL